ncbi:hypothetical protein CLV62_12074 [Dysgonomonas alginatilytica]|uniref:Uncharacterized protein n=1 Tax=Dysgonomonas alginatilytica TaxID=1605892 RepID=A0A2V3PNX6_9BACT|nr:hypothetical protein CLV62_12074 [Dysgonomonas alginatilytica]
MINSISKDTIISKLNQLKSLPCIEQVCKGLAKAENNICTIPLLSTNKENL